MPRIPRSAGEAHPAARRRAAIQRARAERDDATGATPYRVRRVNRTRERSRAALLAAVPEGTRPAQHVAEWSREAKAHPLIDGLRRDARARMHALIDHLAAMQGHSRGVCTVLVLWERLRPVLADMTRRTVANYLHRLHEAGLLCTVAGGRRAEHTPQKDHNEAPVYGFTVPKTPQDYAAEAEAAHESVDTSFTPPPLGVGEDHVRAREDEFSERSRFAAQEMNRRRASRSAWHTCRAQRKAPLWSRHATVAQDEGGHLTRQAVRTRLHEMAMTLQEHAPDTRDVSTAHVASIMRPFVLAGWSVADVQHALDWTPDGTRHWQAAQGMGRIDAWMRARLAHWTREDGTPARSFTQERRDHEAQVRAQIAADRARAAEARRTAARTIPAEARAALDAIRAANAERRAAERHRRAVPVLS